MNNLYPVLNDEIAWAANNYQAAVSRSDWTEAEAAMTAWQAYRQMLLLWTAHTMKERV